MKPMRESTPHEPCGLFDGDVQVEAMKAGVSKTEHHWNEHG